MKRHGQDMQDALDNLRAVITEALISSLLSAYLAGKLTAAIQSLKKEMKDPINWLDVAADIQTLYYAKRRGEELQQDANNYEEDARYWYHKSEDIRAIARKNHNCRVHGWSNS